MINVFRTAAALGGLAAILTLGLRAPASAQTSPCGYWAQGAWVSTPCAPPASEPRGCGYWSEGAWVATPCAPHPRRVAVSGTIVDVDGTMLTVQVGPARTVAVNDRPALNRMDTGRIYEGRVITAYGYWSDTGEFVATSID